MGAGQTLLALLQDDPLSALDHQVGHHLVEEGFKKLLKQRGRTLILATHCLPLLSQADHVSALPGRLQDSGKTT